MDEAVCYVRVSTLEQANQGQSLGAQESGLLRYCQKEGLKVVAMIRDQGVSGGIPLAQRPGGAQLITSLQTKAVRHVVAMKLDRLFRDTQDALKVLDAWDRHGATLHLVDMGGQAFVSTASGKMLLTLLASFSEFERSLISERTAAALAHKKRHGKVYSHLPYGFVKGVDNDLVPCAEEQRVLRYIFACRRDHQSLAAIARRLNELKIPAKRGATWHAATLAHIVKNGLYAYLERSTDNVIPWPATEVESPTAQGRFAEQMMQLSQRLRTGE